MKVSVIIAYKKDRGFLNEAIESVENQNYNDLELILSQSNNSVGHNINEGVKRCSGEFICFLSDDDLLPTDSIQDRVNGMKDFDFIHSRGIQLFPNNTTKPYNLTNPNANFKSILESNGVMGNSTMYKAEVLKNNPFDEMLWTAEEWEYHLRLLVNGYKLGFLDKYTYIYRRHAEQKSIGNLSPEYQRKRNEVKQHIRNLYSSFSPDTP